MVFLQKKMQIALHFFMMAASAGCHLHAATNYHYYLIVSSTPEHLIQG